MKYEVSFIPVILGILVIYGIVAVGLLKNGMKGVYSRRNRKEKLMTAGILILSVCVMLLFAARQGILPEQNGVFSQGAYDVLSWLFAGDIQIMSLVIYLCLGVPIIGVGTMILELVSMRYQNISLPFHFYMLLFVVDVAFYNPMKEAVSNWFLILVLMVFLYCLLEAIQNGKSKKKLLFLVVLAAAGILVVGIEQTVAIGFVLGFVLLLVENIVVAFLLNFAGVLRKTLWRICVVVGAVGMLFLHLYTVL